MQFIGAKQDDQKKQTNQTASVRPVATGQPKQQSPSAADSDAELSPLLEELARVVIEVKAYAEAREARPEPFQGLEQQLRGLIEADQEEQMQKIRIDRIAEIQAQIAKREKAKQQNSSSDEDSDASDENDVSDTETLERLRATAQQARAELELAHERARAVHEHFEGEIKKG